MLKLHPSVGVGASGPFRFQAMWMQHKDFSSLIANNWLLCTNSLLCKEKCFAECLAKWNKEVFGNIFHQKKRLLARLAGIQKSLGRSPNPFLVTLEHKLIEEYNTIRDAEAMYWRQKSRDKWLKDGDRNTKFFHLSTIVRRRRNKILGLFDDGGVLHSDLGKMKSIAASYFVRMFDAQVRHSEDYILPSYFPDIEPCVLEELGRPVSSKEVHDALFMIGKYKAPGYDGFPAVFFQDNWGICGPDIIHTVSSAFMDASVPKGLNHTLITLVPKASCPQVMHLFRPISLCCTVYKVLSKVIVARLRPLLCRWISPNQVSFVPGRHISDNVMIAQELLHKSKYAYGKKGFIAWKIDLSKAYDKLSWSFIRYVLGELMLPSSLIDLIMDCVSSTTYQVLVNGSLSESFKGSRGIRQGDPLSPYLFVLCMEKLSHMISHAVAAEVWKPVKSTRFGPHISHLFFADDLILFSEASSTQAMVLKKVMDIFCDASGQSVSFEKSMIHVSANVSKELAKEISDVCGSPLTPELGKYLGMPLLHSKVNKNTYAYLVDQARSRLAAWKCKSLSMAGRLTLIHSVTSAIPIYAMQTAKLPIATCDALDKINRNFLWGDTPERRRVHSVNWAAVCRPKRLGGLGIKRTRDMNQAMLAKASWRLIQRDEGLWSQVYQKKYLMNASLLHDYKKPHSCSSTWASVVHGAELLNRGLRWRIGNGRKVRFWEDWWSEYGRLREFLDETCDVDLTELVCDYWVDKEWDVEKLSRFLPQEFVESICAIPIALSEIEDKVIWHASSDGKFSVKSAYLLNHAEDSSSCYFWFRNWSLSIPPKLKIFLWTMVAGKLMTNQQRATRKFTSDPSCPHCPDQVETTLHMLRDCPKAMMLWSACHIPSSLRSSFRLDLSGWLRANLTHHRAYDDDVPWKVIFVFCCWYVWKWRCKCMFDRHFNLPFNLLQVVMTYVHEWRGACAKKEVMRRCKEVELCWVKPAVGSFKVNVDGSRSSGGVIGAGGVLRDHLGAWCSGFMVSLGVGEVLQAEAWGLYHGLQMALRYGVDVVELESDSEVLVHLMQDSDISLHPLGTLLHNCREMMRSFRVCSLAHVHRERNFVADCLAKSSLDMEAGVCFLDEAPSVAVEAILDDIAGRVRKRMIVDEEATNPAGMDGTSCRDISFYFCSTSHAS